ncbi:MAG TPA: hypothetical protein VIX80_08550 [Candidatus Kapabacteria bacterium]
MRSHRNKVKALYDVLDPHQIKLLDGLNLTPLEQSIFSHHISGEDSYSLSELTTTLGANRTAISRASSSLLDKITGAISPPSSIEYLHLLQRADLRTELHDALRKHCEESMTLLNEEQEQYIITRMMFMSWVPDDKVITQLMKQFVHVLREHHSLDDEALLRSVLTLVRRELLDATVWSTHHDPLLQEYFEEHIKTLEPYVVRSGISQLRVSFSLFETSFHMGYTHDKHELSAVSKKRLAELTETEERKNAPANHVWIIVDMCELGMYEELCAFVESSTTASALLAPESSASFLYYYLSKLALGDIAVVSAMLEDLKHHPHITLGQMIYHKQWGDVLYCMCEFFTGNASRATSLLQDLLRPSSGQFLDTSVEVALRMIESAVAFSGKEAHAYQTIRRNKKWTTRKHYGKNSEEYRYMSIMYLLIKHKTITKRTQTLIDTHLTYLYSGIGVIYRRMIEIVIEQKYPGIHIKKAY